MSDRRRAQDATSSREHGHPHRLRDFNARSRMQIVPHNFACAILCINLARIASSWRGDDVLRPTAVRARRGTGQCVLPQASDLQARAFRASQRNDCKFILDAISACESRIRKFQESGLAETFSVASAPASLNLRSQFPFILAVRPMSYLRRYRYFTGTFALFKCPGCRLG